MEVNEKERKVIIEIFKFMIENGWTKTLVPTVEEFKIAVDCILNEKTFDSLNNRH